ncbi:hypothetical protein Ocin01_04456 [Orchesella cincta]|uniref:Uncharacterized protein n=1 Tax=Orchesella cincta TaxID=48709 RepID=A0A1D2NB32_ORCCI|nr:hypothetical protein Ocin01_04456 [Orchesella cincta]
MPCKTFLRHDQTSSQRSSSSSKEVTIYAPTWVQEGVKIVGNKLKSIEFQVHEKPSLKRGRNADTVTPKLLESFIISEDLNNKSLVLLHKIARNEPRNTNGIINLTYYSPDIKDTSLIYFMKDLARQSIVVGKDTTTFLGGYKSPKVKQAGEPVYLCDLAALQFQKPYNSGRLVLLQQNDPYKGPFDDVIFEHVVGEKKKSFAEVNKAKDDEGMKKRYLKHDGYGGKAGPCYLDGVAYRKFVKTDVLLCGLALADLAAEKGDQLNFKFLKYGTGYFAGKFVKELNSLILFGVVDGLEELFSRKDNKNVLDVIKALEFPFYECDPDNRKRLDELKKRYNVEYRFSRDDALKQTMKGSGLITATTNCADSNVACGNAMGFKSTDGAIAENLLSKGNIFCPNMNNLMSYKYLDV